MAKFRTGTRNLLAAIPTLLLLSVSSFQGPIPPRKFDSKLITMVQEAARKLSDSPDLTRDLSDLREIFFLVDVEGSTSRNVNTDIVKRHAALVLQDQLKAIDSKLTSDDFKIIKVDVEFMSDEDKVKFSLQCGSERMDVEFNVNRRTMIGKEAEEMKNNFIPEDTLKKARLMPMDAWKKVLQLGGILPEHTVVEVPPHSLPTNDFAKRFNLKYNPAIFRGFHLQRKGTHGKEFQYTVTRSIYLNLVRADNAEYVLTWIGLKYLDSFDVVVDSTDSYIDVDQFWREFDEHFREIIEKHVLSNPDFKERRSLADLSHTKDFQSLVDGFMVKSKLTYVSTDVNASFTPTGFSGVVGTKCSLTLCANDDEVTVLYDPTFNY
eukprot:GHVS01026221.1.p1 GENE.GHVS01026221.1~~GHVS01026221.1.p1  ORF type:complete len:377 (-),score=11.92 GHVS01026221.1:172-1302(-)